MTRLVQQLTQSTVGDSDQFACVRVDSHMKRANFPALDPPNIGLQPTHARHEILRPQFQKSAMPIFPFFSELLFGCIAMIHTPPHIHAESQGNTAKIDFGGNVLLGRRAFAVARPVFILWPNCHTSSNFSLGGTLAWPRLSRHRARPALRNDRKCERCGRASTLTRAAPTLTEIRDAFSPSPLSTTIGGSRRLRPLRASLPTSMPDVEIYFGNCSKTLSLLRSVHGSRDSRRPDSQGV